MNRIALLIAEINNKIPNLEEINKLKDEQLNKMRELIKEKEKQKNDVFY